MTRDQAVLTFWHEYNLALFVVASARRGDLPHASFTTATPRGTVIRTLFESMARGPIAVLPLPEERDPAAARSLARLLGELGASGYSLVVTPDGPWGPYRVAKPGALIVARQSGLPILPLAVRARPALRLTRRWDRQLVPLPFSTISVVTGDTISVGPREPLRAQLVRLQGSLDGVTARTDA
jgi:lysophospholipid acyltransferase (LPLAT)-like uncharacterized protein